MAVAVTRAQERLAELVAAQAALVDGSATLNAGQRANLGGTGINHSQQKQVSR